MGYPNSHQPQFPKYDSLSFKRFAIFFYLIFFSKKKKLSQIQEKIKCQNLEKLKKNFFFNFKDKTLIVWKLNKDESSCGTPYKSLKGHSHFVSDAVISSDGQFCLSGSWDGTLRLWDLTQYATFFSV